MKLKSIDEYNAGVIERREMARKRELRKRRKMGIACPKCGAELVEWKNSLGSSITLVPLRQLVGCPECDYRDSVELE